MAKEAQIETPTLVCPTLPAGIKLELPQPFKGQMDGDSLRAFILSFELYCVLTGMTTSEY